MYLAFSLRGDDHRDRPFANNATKAKASFTAEARDAQRDGGYPRALRRLAKRYCAISQASPYVVGELGLADSFVFVGGVLCYILEARPKRWLRILDLRGPADVELVVNIPSLISEAVPRSYKSQKYKFKVLYHANGITSCLFTFALPRTENWLLVFDAQKQQIIEKVQLDSTSKIFVRNNHQYLYYGTHSEDGADGHRKWVISGFDIRIRRWFSNKVHLSNIVGHDIGYNVCFEIIDNYFYGVSNRTASELEAFNWTSYYFCFRFPLDDPHPRKIQEIGRHDSWRRKHSEGPIDDRWGLMALQQDEASGIIKIIESRREWLKGGSVGRRTYYTKKVYFNDDLSQQQAISRQADDQVPLQTGNYSSEDDETSTYSEPEDEANHLTPQLRSPHDVHPDESSETSLTTRSQIHLCSYNSCCQTFLDLVNDTPEDGSSNQCLRLRTGHRRLKPVEEGSVAESPPSDDELTIDNKIKHTYRPNEIYTWPKRKSPSEPDLGLDEVYQLLNPPNHVGYVSAMHDERSIIYASGEGPKKLKTLIYLSFDPATKLAGMSHKRTGLGLGQLEGSTSPRRAEEGPGAHAEASMDNTSSEKARHISVDDKQKGGAILDGPQSQLPPNFQGGSFTDDQLRQTLPSPGGGAGWVSVQKAMHHDMRGKYSFAIPRPAG
ncbi:hypothetical protein F5X96DRAFT_676050 [Biscogniauxia mediterranea]|nr:hypothetical protein F5X96DRAFT_676050 [Biscogniauxia mediterranea]